MKSAPVVVLTTFILQLHHFLSGVYQSEILIGCYEEFQRFQSASLRNRSFLQCVSTCKIYKFPFIAIKSGLTCHCGDITDSRVLSQECTILCSDVPHSCGGFNLYAVYAIVPFYHGCFTTEITNSTKNLTLSCQEFCPQLQFSYLTDEDNLCKCWGLFHRVGRTLLDDCAETCKPTEGCQNSFKTEVYSSDFIPGLNKFYTDIFMCLNGKPNQNATCDLGLCIDGWKGKKCDQRNCSMNNGECDESECKEFRLGNTGYSECLCKKGFTNGLTLFDNCKDEDECKSNPCNTSISSCVNEIGSYSCSCFDGYTPDVKTIGCKDINECLKGECLYDGTTCENTIGSFMCLCRHGYRLIEDEYCHDIPDRFSGCSLNYFECNEGLCKNLPTPGRCQSIDVALSKVLERHNFFDDNILWFVAVIAVCMCVVIILAHLKDRKIKHEIREENRNNEQTAAEEGLDGTPKEKSSISLDIDEKNT